MNEKEKIAKEKIQSALAAFASSSMERAGLQLFEALGYRSERRFPLSPNNAQTFMATFFVQGRSFNPDQALVPDWQSVDFLFQLTDSEIQSNGQSALVFDSKDTYDGSAIQSYLFFAIDLKRDLYSRTQLASITRAVNRLFDMPALLLFKHGDTITLSIIHRRLHKRDESKDVLLKKVTLIKDINIANPHRAHIEILSDLSFDELLRKHKFTNFVELHKAWEKTLDIKELNRSFYNELFNWYLWASKINVKFPQIRPEEDMLDDKVHQSESLIRLLTRLLFCWFMKEKGLIKDDTFDPSYIKTILKDFQTPGSDETIYYKAILQNLFFATLSKPITDRKLIGKVFPNPHYGDQLVYRYVEFFKDDINILELFSNIPFLNGGLFDCLDRRKDRDNPGEIRLDGFSNTKSKQPVVPDKLFFGEYKNIDLSEDYDDKKKSNQTVHGLIDILYRYKFTIEENTPIEEEIALDPELLGKVFENLLASYNPETKTTARKQTGSFFTPREIVDYMVGESLVAYLEQRLKNDIPELKGMDALSEMLREVLSYTEEAHPFNDKEVDALIQAFDNVKIIDPACGSGAFPMGMLQKMLHLLRKIDPENKKWFEKVIAKFPAYLQNEMRSKLQHENWDYVRKLGIIQECIYGVDIQPIAIQIAKLRFFISLLVDQKEKPGMDNRGFEPLPNLDFKLVAANTLIAPPETDAPDNGLFADTFTVDFEKLTGQYFSTYLPEEKKSIKEQIASLITRKCDEKIKQTESRSWHANEQAAKALKEKHKDYIQEKEQETRLWNSYKNLFKNESVGFFDKRYFFPGVTAGFDIVIGNPPYVQIQKFSGMQEQQDWERQQYKTYARTGDVYCLFYERGYRILGNNGVLAFITSNKWMRANYGKAMRRFFANNGAISQLIDFGDSPIFENATTYTNILIWKKNGENVKTKAWDLSKAYENDASLDDLLEKQGEREPLFNEDSFVIVEDRQRGIKKRIEEIGTPLRDWDIAINYGIKTGLNEAFIIDGKKKDELISKDPKSEEIIKPILRGRDIKRYRAEFADLWIMNTHNGYGSVPPIDVKNDYPAIWECLRQVNSTTNGGLEKRQDQGNHWSNLRNCAYIPEFDMAKVVYAEIVYDSAFYYDTMGYYSEATTFLMTGERLKFLVALLNSRLLTYAFKTFYAGGDLRGSTFRYKKVFLEQLPVPKLSPDVQFPFEVLVDHILFAKENNLGKEAAFFERLIDSMVYELFFPEEIKSVGCEVLKYLASLPEVNDSWSNEQKLVAIEKSYKELSDPTHPASIAMKKMQDLPEVRIIEGRQ
jgi:adenine-specific DNA-methyltransferase